MRGLTGAASGIYALQKFTVLHNYTALLSQDFFLPLVFGAINKQPKLELFTPNTMVVIIELA